jgi:hypothetical protein
MPSAFRKALWMFPIAATLHNAEEALYMPAWVSAHSQQLPVHPSALTIRIGLLVVTLAAWVVSCLSRRKGEQTIWAYLLFGGAVAMLANVFVPHLPATLVFRQYTPGVVTAVLLNLPAMSVLLWLALRDGWVSGMKAMSYALSVPLVLAVSIWVVFVERYS